MNTKRVLLFLSVCIAILSIHGFAQYLYLDSSLTITTPSTLDSVRITPTGRLTADDSIAVIGNMIIDSGGVITHSLRLLEGLRLKVLGTLDIKSGGMIDVSAKGLRGGAGGGSLFGKDGEAYDSLDQIVAGAADGAGASYGGFGANSVGVTNPCYGLLEDPRHLGAGGGGTTNGWRAGGHGGGRITINANVCIVDGVIRANGGDGVGSNPESGGGSGGGVRINIGSLSGTGTIEANGGNGLDFYATTSGSGSGGRIAIYFDTLSYAVNKISARGNSGGHNSGAGTIYLKDNAQTNGDFIVDNGNVSANLYTPFMTNFATFQSVNVKNQGQLHPVIEDVSSFTVEHPVGVFGSSSLWLGNDVTMSVSNPSGFDVNTESGSTLLLDTNSVLNANAVRISGGTLTTYVDLAFPVGSDLELSGGGQINISNNRTLSIERFDTTNIKSGTINLSKGSQLNITSNAGTLGAGVTLSKDGTFGLNDSINTMIIDSGGVITHSLRLLEGLHLKVLGTLEIKSGGMIDVSAKGLRGGYNGSLFGKEGETYDSLDQIVSGAIGGIGPGNVAGAGASYGGLGANAWGTTNPCYGVVEDARHLGSGGGGAVAGSRPGGHGGGRVTIAAAICVIDGAIRANGGSGAGWNAQSGGGSGGAIRLNVGNLSGTGIIEANGGDGLGVDYYGVTTSGAGGGGRIAVYYDTRTLPDGKFTVHGSSNGHNSSAGTVYLKDNSDINGSVIVDNNNIDCALYTPWRSDLPNLQRLTLRNRAQLKTVASDNAVFGEATIESNSILLLDTATTVQTPIVRIMSATLTTNVDRSFPGGTDLQLSGGGTINVRNNRTLSVGVFDTTNFRSGTLDVAEGSRLDIASNTATIGRSVTLVKDGKFDVDDSIQALSIDSGGVVTHSLRLLEGLRLKVLGTLEIKSGGMIDVSAKGLRGGAGGGSLFGKYGETFDSLDQVVTGAADGAGASYGGFGANSVGVTNPCYGLLEDPRHLGAGGGGTTNGWRAGGHGGGRITINATVCIVDGVIRANGGDGVGSNPESGGGSGGGVRINVGNLSGTGTIEANGGNGLDFYATTSGSGGGGRIAIYFDTLSYAVNKISARGNSGGHNSGAGTIYLKDNAQTNGDFIVDNSNVPCDLFTPWRSALTTIQDITVVNAGKLSIDSDIAIKGQLLVTGGGKIGRP